MMFPIKNFCDSSNGDKGWRPAGCVQWCTVTDPGCRRQGRAVGEGQGRRRGRRPHIHGLGVRAEQPGSEACLCFSLRCVRTCACVPKSSLMFSKTRRN